MWPVCVIVDKMLEVAAAAGQERDDQQQQGGGGIAMISRGSRFIDVPHVRQLFSWDCGLACVSMVLTAIGVGDFDIHRLADLCSTTRHYVVICGYDADTKEFEIRDPASARKYERVSLACLDEARKSFGTDEDILLVSLSGKKGDRLASKP